MNTRYSQASTLEVPHLFPRLSTDTHQRETLPDFLVIEVISRTLRVSPTAVLECCDRELNLSEPHSGLRATTASGAKLRSRRMAAPRHAIGDRRRTPAAGSGRSFLSELSEGRSCSVPARLRHTVGSSVSSVIADDAKSKKAWTRALRRTSG